MAAATPAPYSIGLWYLAGAVLLGAIVGMIFARAWRLFFPPATQRRFWLALAALSQEVLVVDALAEFLSLYRRLGTTLLIFLGRNLGVLVAGGGAIVVAVIVGLQPLNARLDASSGKLVASDPAVELTARQARDRVLYRVAGKAVTVARSPPPREAICWTSWSCAGLALLDFHVIEERAPARTRPRAIIFRTTHGDKTPLWPYLNDLETLFLLALTLSSSAGILWPSRTTGAPTPSILRHSDFALVQINTQLQPIMRAIGKRETRMFGLDLPELRAPIFIAGMARSGTTLLLNALTHSPELGAHQYRDFPFLMAPLLWDRLQGAMAKDVQPVERPHKDRIMITKFSHDAFEEPLWQAFFSHIHDPAIDQRLRADTSNLEFEHFFADHLRKIISLRGAKRYVSKGNYNVGRIEYLGRLFPDAHFLVPVRSPVDHIASLLSQHALFCRYAMDDPRIPSYLAAAGHYEFGPQRRAIKLSAAPANADAIPPESDAIFYARQWVEVYGHIVSTMANSPGLARRITLVRYEDLCADPADGLRAIIAACGLADPDHAIQFFADTISISRARIPAAVEAQRSAIHDIVAPTAAQLGYALA